MNKKVWFFLFPVIALILSITCREGSAMLSKKADEVVYAAHVAKHATPGNIRFQSHPHHHISPKMRVKAWDNYVAAQFSGCSVTAPAAHFSPVIYGGYRLYAPCTYYASYSLRGPPVRA